MVNTVNIRANVVCYRTNKRFLSTMYVMVHEEDGVPLYPPQTTGCARCSVMAPCPACTAHVLNEVFRALPLPNRSSIEIDPTSSILGAEAAG